MSAAPSVGVVVVNYNSAAFIGQFIDSLDRVTYPNTRLVIVDSGSTDGSLREIELRRPDATLLRAADNVGTAGGNNIGARHCLDQQLDYLLFLNDDTTHESDFIEKLVLAADESTIVVPRILYAADHRLISTHAGDFDWNLGLFRNTYHGKADGEATRHKRSLQTASFCCLLMPAQAFTDAGPLDERFFMYYEETDMLKRAIEAGYEILYIPEAVVYHRESASSGGGWMTPLKMYYATRNRPYLVRKHMRSRLRYALFTCYFWATRLPYVARYLTKGQPKLLRALVLGMIDYYRGRMGRTLQVQDF